MLFNNGELVIHLTDVNYRAESSIQIMGVHFNTFYGGSDSSWYPQKETSADFKNFALDHFTDSLLPSDVDNCQAAVCHQDATCTSLFRDYSCKCNSGFVGDGKTCVKSSSTGSASSSAAGSLVSDGCNGKDITLNCAPSQIEMLVPECFFTERQINPQTAKIGQNADDAKCIG